MATPGKTYIRTLTVLVRVNVGPPTWWIPNVGIDFGARSPLLILKFGWLRTAVQIGIGSKRHHEERELRLADGDPAFYLEEIGGEG